MSGERQFLYIIVVLAALFVLYEGISLIAVNGKTARILGETIDVKTINTGRGKNKTARFTYRVNNQTYRSFNRLNVPLHTENGTKLYIKYFLDDPSHISTHSIKRLVIGIAVTILFFILALNRS